MLGMFLDIHPVHRKACDEGDLAEACHRYSALFIKGVKDVCDKNMAEAFKYSLKVSQYR